MIGADRRGRITVPDVVFLLMSLAFFGALFPVMVAGLDANADSIGRGPTMLFSLIGPMAALILLATLYRKAVVGA